MFHYYKEAANGGFFVLTRTIYTNALFYLAALFYQ